MENKKYKIIFHVYLCFVTFKRVLFTWAVRYRVEVSPPFFFVFFFSGRSCSARALSEC